jgi:hypothetical protein
VQGRKSQRTIHICQQAGGGATPTSSDPSQTECSVVVGRRRRLCAEAARARPQWRRIDGARRRRRRRPVMMMTSSVSLRPARLAGPCKRQTCQMRDRPRKERERASYLRQLDDRAPPAAIFRALVWACKRAHKWCRPSLNRRPAAAGGQVSLWDQGRWRRLRGLNSVSGGAGGSGDEDEDDDEIRAGGWIFCFARHPSRQQWRQRQFAKQGIEKESRKRLI